MRIGHASPSPASHPTAPRAESSSRAAGRPKSFTTVLDEGTALGPRAPVAAAAPKAAVGSPAAPAARAAAPAAGGPVRAMLERAVGAEKQVDALLEAAARGKTFTPAQLLGMQATVARYSQTVEVVSRVADRLVGAIKQTMGTQV